MTDPKRTAERFRSDHELILAANLPRNYRSPFDDPDWVAADIRRWDERNRLGDHLARTFQDISPSVLYARAVTCR